MHNLHYYTWNNGTVTQDVFDDLGVIDVNTWYKLKVKAHGSAFDIYFNGDLSEQHLMMQLLAPGQSLCSVREETQHNSMIFVYVNMQQQSLWAVSAPPRSLRGNGPVQAVTIGVLQTTGLPEYQGRVQL